MPKSKQFIRPIAETMENEPISKRSATITTQKRAFILKNLIAEEIMTIDIGEEFADLKDLRREVHRRYGIPYALQQFVTDGRTYDRHYDDTTPLDNLLPRTFSPNPTTTAWTHIVWLLWMRNTDYLAVHTGRMFAEEEYDAKEALAASQDRPFEAVTLKAWTILVEILMG